jgi:hypothetical protein
MRECYKSLNSIQEIVDANDSPRASQQNRCCYCRGISRYLLLSWHHKVKSNPDSGSELIVYESPELWGPFTLVHHEDSWETSETEPIQSKASPQMVRSQENGRMDAVFRLVTVGWKNSKLPDACEAFATGHGMR